MLINSTELI